MKDLIVHQVNIAHYRLIELSKLADQAKPFYDWVEKHARRVTGSHRPLNEILLKASREELAGVITACYSDAADETPLLFDGIGRVYPHAKACFYFFAWMMRDAPRQRLEPLISRMRKADNVSKMVAETDSLAALILEYRDVAKSFDWEVIREVVLDRLEGSRRSIKGHSVEAYVRTGLVTAIQYYYSIHGNYGEFRKVDIANKQIKVGKHTVDVSADLFPRSGRDVTKLLIPVKTRETEGGGHSHLFTRDVITALVDIKAAVQTPHIAAVIIAENWSGSDMDTIKDQIDLLFYFDMNPNRFLGFDEDRQIEFNKYMASILGGKDV
ncbi:MAG: hypothetical protein V2B18_14980 [Pseudomonadota bacterium]